MSIEIKVPQLPESVADATLVTWHKQAGQAVTRDENLADLETDKVVLEVPAPVNGVLKELRIVAGTSVTSGQVLAVLEEGGAAAAAPAKAAAAGCRAAAKAAPVATPAAANDNGKLAPSVRRMVEEKQLDPSKIPATGRDGRITKGDVVEYLDKPAAKAAGGGQACRQARAGAACRRRRPQRSARADDAPARSASPQRLVEAQSTQALLTTFNEVDLKAVMDVRAKYKDSFEKKHGVKLGFMSFFVKAAIEALKKFPAVNASDRRQRHRVSRVLRHRRRGLDRIAASWFRCCATRTCRATPTSRRTSARYAAKARDGKITIEELTGGTFSITNGGTFGSLLSTPIVNMPQSAILGMHKTRSGRWWSTARSRSAR